MSVVAVYQTSKPHELGRKADELMRKADHNAKQAGLMLTALKGAKPPGILWELYLKDSGWTFTARRANQLIREAQEPESERSPKNPSESISEQEIISQPDVDDVEESREASAEAMKAKSAELDDDDGDQTKQPPRADVAKLVRAWVTASPEAKREFVRERWDEIARARKQLDANGAAHEDRWIEGDAL
jgi:hypothetical protein